jgi:hypothetical protein
MTDDRWRCFRCTMTFRIGPEPEPDKRRTDSPCTCPDCGRQFWHFIPVARTDRRAAVVVGLTRRPC